MSKIYTSATQLIGHTPLLKVTNYSKDQNIEGVELLAKSSSKAIYFFPFHWMIELWRNLAYVGFCSVTQPPKLYRISSLVWMGDFFPCTYTPYILIPHSPVPLHLTLEVIIKICICAIAILFSIQTILQRNTKRNCFETAV